MGRKKKEPKSEANSPDSVAPIKAIRASDSTDRMIVSWFEIPVLDMTRAVDFYRHILSVEMEVTQAGDHSMAAFPQGPGGVGGALVQGPGSVPSPAGTLVYLNAGDDLDAALELVADSGGRVIMEKTPVGDAGCFALFIDTEGNKIALHSDEGAQ
ncbi:MAG: putative enzyme related to lactoylglutathione lyase [Planctomycetota bacterium]|jgi:predicted enzyme related to lactoylglutathione lyase